MNRAGAAALVRGPGALAAAGMAVNAANLLVNVLLGRLLSSGQYGQSAVLVGVFLVAAIPGTALQVGVVRRLGAAARGADGDPADLAALRRRTWLLAGASALVGLLVMVPGAHALSLTHPLGLELVLAAAGCCLPLAVARASLQAGGRYPALAANLALEGGLRVAVCVAGALLGLGAQSLAVGVLVSTLACEVHARRGARPPSGARLPSRDRSGVAPVGVRAEASAALAALAPLAVLQNLDVIVVGHLAPHQVGPYAAVATAAKVPVFLGVAVGNYLLAEAAGAPGRRGPAPALLASAACVLAPAGVLLVVALAAPRALLTLVYGARLSTAAAALTPLTLAMSCLALTMLGSYHLLGAGRRSVVAVLLVAAVVTPGVAALGGGRPVATAWLMLACQGALAAVVGLLVVTSTARVRAGADGPPAPYRPRSWARSTR